MGVGCKVLEKKQFYITKPKLEEEEIWSTWQKLTGDSGIQHWEGATWHCVKFNLACLWWLHSWPLATYYTPCQLSILLFLPSHFLPQPSSISTQEKKNALFLSSIIYFFIFLIYFFPPNSFVSNSPTQFFFN